MSRSTLSRFLPSPGKLRKLREALTPAGTATEGAAVSKPMRLLGLDVGTRYCGLSIADVTNGIVMPHSELLRAIPKGTHTYYLPASPLFREKGLQFAQDSSQAFPPDMVVPDPQRQLRRVALEEVSAALNLLCKKHRVLAMVVGLPLNLDSSFSESTSRTVEFIEQLKHEAGLKVPIVWADERWSSVDTPIMADAHSTTQQPTKPTPIHPSLASQQHTHDMYRVRFSDARAATRILESFVRMMNQVSAAYEEAQAAGKASGDIQRLRQSVNAMPNTAGIATPDDIQAMHEYCRAYGHTLPGMPTPDSHAPTDTSAEVKTRNNLQDRSNNLESDIDSEHALEAHLEHVAESLLDRYTDDELKDMFPDLDRIITGIYPNEQLDAVSRDVADDIKSEPLPVTDNLSTQVPSWEHDLATILQDVTREGDNDNRIVDAHAEDDMFSNHKQREHAHNLLDAVASGEEMHDSEFAGWESLSEDKKALASELSERAVYTGDDVVEMMQEAEHDIRHRDKDLFLKMHGLDAELLNDPSFIAEAKQALQQHGYSTNNDISRLDKRVKASDSKRRQRKGADEMDDFASMLGITGASVDDVLNSVAEKHQNRPQDGRIHNHQRTPAAHQDIHRSRDSRQNKESFASAGDDLLGAGAPEHIQKMLAAMQDDPQMKALHESAFGTLDKDSMEEFDYNTTRPSNPYADAVTGDENKFGLGGTGWDPLFEQMYQDAENEGVLDTTDGHNAEFAEEITRMFSEAAGEATEDGENDMVDEHKELLRQLQSIMGGSEDSDDGELGVQHSDAEIMASMAQMMGGLDTGDINQPPSTANDNDRNDVHGDSRDIIDPQFDVDAEVTNIPDIDSEELRELVAQQSRREKENLRAQKRKMMGGDDGPKKNLTDELLDSW